MTSETAEVVASDTPHISHSPASAPHQQPLECAGSAPQPACAAEGSNNAPPVSESNGDQSNTAPSPTKSISERRGKRPLQLFVANPGDSSCQSDQAGRIRREPSQDPVQWPSGSSTPLPQYTSYVDDRPADLHSLRDVKHGLILSYVTQQQEAHEKARASTNQQAKTSTTPDKEPPSYVSATEPDTLGASANAAEAAEHAFEPPQRPPSTPGLRPLILPTWISKRSVEALPRRKKEPALRPLLLPQDLRERSQYTMVAPTPLSPAHDSSDIGASICKSPIHALRPDTTMSARIDGILKLLDDSGVTHSTPILRAGISVFPFIDLGSVHGSVASLASTHGTASSGSSEFVSEESRRSILILPSDDCLTDWENEIISIYCDVPCIAD